MSKALETVTASDFTMVRDNDNQVITVKSASLDATDKTKVSLTVYTSLTDAKTYTVTYTAADEAKTQSSKQVTVTDGTVADVAITPVEITANQETLIEYQTLDATGVVISQKGVTKADTNIDASWDSLLGTMNNETSKYILYNEGDSAKFSVTYHTYKYDTTTGAEIGVISKDFTVTAVKDASVISQYNYTIATSKPFDWSKVTPKQTIALDDTGRRAYFQIKDSKGADVTSTCGYTVESSDNSVVVADGDVNGAILSTVNKGSAYLMIKDKDGKVVHTLPITVGEKRTISTFKLSASVVNIASTAAFTGSPETCAYTDVTAKDQYGDDISVSLDYENKTNNNVAKLTLDAPAAKSIRVEGSSATGIKGSDTFIIKATDNLGKSMTTSLRVNSLETSGNVTYSVVFLDRLNGDKVVSSVDTTVSETAAATASTKQDLRAVVVKKQNNVVVSKLTTANVQSLKVVKNDGTTVASVASASAAVTSSAAIDSIKVLGATGAGVTVSNLDITAKNTDAGLVADKYLGAGTYTVVYELVNADGGTTGRVDRASASFTVKDSQTGVSAVVKETNCGSRNDLENILQSTAFVEYYYGDVRVDGNVKAVKQTISNGAKNSYVSNVTVIVPVADGGNYIKTTIPVNRTFIGSGWPTTVTIAD